MANEATRRPQVRTPVSQYVAMPDGTLLALDLYLPDGAASAPVILAATQYGRRRQRDGREISMLDEAPSLRRLFQEGYAVVILDMRGTGASFGTKNGHDIPTESPFIDDLAAILEWIGAQPWCSGAIGMYGYSYVAGTQLAAAVAGSRFLKCIAPQQVSVSAFRGYMNVGGIQNLAFRERVDRLMYRIGIDQPAAPVDADAEGALLAAAVEEHRRMQPSAAVLRARRFADDGPAADRGIDTLWPAIAASGVAILHVGGWRDLYPDETLRLYETLRESNPSWLVMGPWTHGAQERDPGGAGIDLSDILLRFYDHFLRGGEYDEPRVRYAIMPASATAPSAADWRDASHWPSATTRITLYVAADGLRAEPPKTASVATYPVDRTLSTSGLATRYSMDEGQIDYGEWAARAWTCASLPFERTTEIIGAPLLRLTVGATVEDLALFAYLLQVSDDGRTLPVTEGFLRLANRAEGPARYATLGLPHHPTRRADQLAMPPGGKSVRLRIAMLPVAARIAEGSRLMLAVAAADEGTWEVPPLEDGTALMFHRDGWSGLDLPLAQSLSKS